ncbi:MAG: hypothetical protein U5R48_13920 [Gammaproteobacteria bacterium]|nr:hypothetical protein [Gammaproteobacteria bacterium]
MAATGALAGTVEHHQFPSGDPRPALRLRDLPPDGYADSELRYPVSISCTAPGAARPTGSRRASWPPPPTG